MNKLLKPHLSSKLRRHLCRFSFSLARQLAAWTPNWVERHGMNSFSLLLSPSDQKYGDAIVILGRGNQMRAERVNLAATLWQQGRATSVFVSGRGDAFQIAAALEHHGIPAEMIQGEPCSKTTYKNAEFAAALLFPQGVKRIILITDLPHMPRACRMFRSFGFQVIPEPCPLPITFGSIAIRFYLWREWMSLFFHALVGHYRPCHAAGSPPTKIVSGKAVKSD